MKAEATVGGCRCGELRFAATGRPILTMACHCEGCRRMTGSAFSLSSLYPSANFTVTQGEPVIGGMHGATRHFFCPRCLSWLFTRPEALDAYVNVRSPMFDAAAEHRPYVDMHLREGFEWASSGAVEQFESVPAEDDFARLAADYAAWDRAA